MPTTTTDRSPHTTLTYRATTHFPMLRWIGHHTPPLRILRTRQPQPQQFQCRSPNLIPKLTVSNPQTYWTHRQSLATHLPYSMPSQSNTVIEPLDIFVVREAAMRAPISELKKAACSALHIVETTQVCTRKNH